MHSAAVLLAGVLTSQLITTFAFAQRVRDIDILWAGTYTVTQSREVEDPAAPTGRRFIASGVQPLSETENIPATLGTRFGVGYMLRGAPEGDRIGVQAFWRFPPTGMTNPQTRTTTFEWKTAPLQCTLEAAPFCLLGYPLQHEWELVPGRWTLEIWVEGRKLAEKSFDVYLP